VDRPLKGAGEAEPIRAERVQPRVLVIEDDPVVRFNIVSYLEDSGFAVFDEADGQAGIDAVRASSPDLVLCDLRMPGLDGLEVLQRLHADRPALPVVVVSGTGVLGDAVEALRKGAWDFVTKPIQDMAVLEHAILGSLDKARLQRENRRFQLELERANEQLRAYIEQLEQDADAGRGLQQQLLPPSERMLGAYRFNRYLLPSLYLSGDFVDYFVIDHIHVGFYLADVSGHGVSSAFVTVLLKSLIDRHLAQYNDAGNRLLLDPAGLLARLNTELLAQQLDKYTTLFYGVINTEDNCLSYSNGGHFPAPVLFDGQGARFLDGRGFPVGLLPDASFEGHTMGLPTHHLLVLCSDGVLDALPAASLAEKQSKLLEAAQGPGLEVDKLLGALGLDPGGAYPDDITLLIAERMV